MASGEGLAEAAAAWKLERLVSSEEHPMALDRERWERIQTVFHAVVDESPEVRDAHLERACGGDDELREAVLQLLHEDASSDSVMDRDVHFLAEQVLNVADAPADGVLRFGPYRVLRELGHGGMGVVFLAQRDDLGQLAAVKVLRDVWVSAAGYARLVGEQRTLAKLTHHSIARLYDADTLSDGTPWFAMEYVEGVSLTDYLAQNRGLQDRLRLFREVCEAVRHAHQYLIVHRDLKPSNIMVTPNGSIKLLDFGIAKQLDSLDGVPDRTRTLLRMMTPYYAAPEEFGAGAVGTHTDIYSLGVILYELLAGVRPFELAGLSSRDAEALVLSSEPPRPSAQASANAGAAKAASAEWEDLDVLCATAMHKDPARRYRTADALIRDVDHFLAGEPLEARPDSLGYRAGKFLRRHSRKLTAAAAILIALTSVVVFYTVRLDAARADAVAQAARTEQIQEFMLQLFDAGETDAAPSNDLRVVTLVDRGVQEARSLDREPVIQAALYHTLGSLYQRLGNFDQADQLLSMALQRRRDLLGAGHPDALETALAIGLLRVDQSRLDEAKRAVVDVRTASGAALPGTHPIVAKATAAVGRVLEERGEYDRAIQMLDEAARLYSLPGSSVNRERELGATLTTLANAHFYAGHLDESEALNQRVLAMDRRLYGDRHPSVADDLLNLGAIASSRERYPEATEHYRNALEILRTWYGDDHPQTASAMTILAQGFMLGGQLDAAAPLLSQALVTQEKVYGPNHRRVGFVLNEIGSLALRRNRYDE